MDILIIIAGFAATWSIVWLFNRIIGAARSEWDAYRARIYETEEEESESSEMRALAGEYVDAVNTGPAWAQGGDAIEESIEYAGNCLIPHTRASLILPGIRITGMGIMRCPKCKEKMPRMEHLENRKCECGLEMYLTGNSLRCRLEADHGKSISDVRLALEGPS